MPNTVRVDVGRLHRCAHCGSALSVRRSTLEPPAGEHSEELDELDAFFERVADDSAARADKMLASLVPSLETSVRRRPRSMGRWMASWLLQQLDVETLPPGVEARVYRREELAVHVAGASVAVDMMVDPRAKSMDVRRMLYRSVGGHRGFTGPADVERAALVYVDALAGHDLAAVGLIGGRRVTHEVVGEGLVVAGSSLTFVAAWSIAAWSHVAPTCTIR